MKIDRQKFLVAAAILGLGTAIVPACGSSVDSERERETTVTVETEGGEYSRNVETEADEETDHEADAPEHRVTVSREVETEREGEFLHRDPTPAELGLRAHRQTQARTQLAEPRQAQPGDGQAQPMPSAVKPPSTGTTQRAAQQTPAAGPTHE